MSVDALEMKTLGFIRVIGGHVCLDHIPLEQYLSQYKDRYVEVTFRFPSTNQYEIDPGILPLVLAMNRVGIETYCSCEGHLEERRGELSRRPYVVFNTGQGQKLPEVLPEGWEIEKLSQDTSVLRTVQEAVSVEELAILHQRVDGFVQALK